MKTKHLQSSLADELGTALHRLLEQGGIAWEEAYVRYSSPTPDQLTMTGRIRNGRDLVGFSSETWKHLPQEKEFAHLNSEIEAVEGQRAKVLVLDVQPGGATRLVYDLENPWALNLEYEVIGEPNSYFGPDEIQIPAETQERMNLQAKWDALLKGRPVLRLSLPDHEYGMPFPQNRWQVGKAIDALLKPTFAGKVLDMDYSEGDGANYDVLIIGVVDLDISLPKLLGLLKSLNISSGATLKPSDKEENLATDLASREDLIRQATETMIQMLLEECKECTPADWQKGALTIQCDGDWLGYKLKNAQSANSATMSARLRVLCEELAVFMWKNGQKWREAVLQYEGTTFTINFSDSEPTDPIPRQAAAVAQPAAFTAAKPWWKLW